MRLQRLEIAGFKSFPDRSELTFDRGVTAIVGPNGCGKSNVVDALTWVLGEQSAKSLRGDRMEDVIFGGSDARKPTAAAEVRLKLAGVAATPIGSRDQGLAQGRPGNGNGAAHALHGTELAGGNPATSVAVALEDDTPLIVRDVELMRRLYRSGESEYLIDGETCRLRDVQDLLMDAGLGIKAYAVIEQGKIGQILSARPTDRRQLIEEAAGVTKYKSRRRAAELKLEAAQQNLTRVDDIVFEVEKQRGALKRQAAKARRYKRLRDGLRRWEKVQFAQKYRLLGQAIESARTRLAAARERETLATARLAEFENGLERLRLELTEADGATTAAREAAHACELEIGRLQQQISFDRQQVEQLGVTASEIETEVHSLEDRRGPAREVVESRRDALRRVGGERDEAASRLTAEEVAYAEAQSQIEGLESDVEAARSEVFAAVNAATALRHAMEHAGAARTRLGEQIGKLEVESADLRIEVDRAASERRAAAESLERAKSAMEVLKLDRAARESELAVGRNRRDELSREMRAREHDFASTAARLKSLEELDGARAAYGDGARMLLSEATEFEHLGSVADYLEVDRRFEKAVEACFAERLQYVVVPSHDHVAEGLRIALERNAGRVGFLVATGRFISGQGSAAAAGLTPLTQIVQISGPAAESIGAMVADTWMAPDFETARAAVIRDGAAAQTIVTMEGDVFRGSTIVDGGLRSESRGILATKREIKELRERAVMEQDAVDRLRHEISAVDMTIASAESAIMSLQGELHRQEKAVVGFELQLGTAGEAVARIGRKQEQIAAERRTAEQEHLTQQARQDEARESIERIEAEQKTADDNLSRAQRRLFDAREAMQVQAHLAAEAKAMHAALVERAGALASEVERLEQTSAELDARLAARGEEMRRTQSRRAELQQAIYSATNRLDSGSTDFEALREKVRLADDRSQELRVRFEEQDGRIRDARRALEAVRGEASQLDVARAMAEADLSHLSSSCMEAVQATLEQVIVEVEQLERDGLLINGNAIAETPDAAEDRDLDEEGSATIAPAAGEIVDTKLSAARTVTPDDMVADLRGRIERMGAVNMMAIDQFDELESRHAFLTSQRKDLVDSIAATGEAIRRIDKTTKERFRVAFTVINQNFEHTFATLFGGGRAGLILLDESDQLESGIDIIAQPPGKRLQNVQLLSGGEKALTAMALMFAIFKYRPSPFCLLDEIDAPLDDANIGRFVEMLQGMQEHTQFILITHNRKTMEIADRLYGVTMEEPGVSKLISVQLN
jgi:chromosome segregation protein